MHSARGRRGDSTPAPVYIVEAREDERRWDDCVRRARGAFAAAQSRLIECHDANRAAQDPLPPPFTRIPCASASQGRVQPLLVAVQLHIFDQRVEHALHLVRVRARLRVKVRVGVGVGVTFRVRVRVRGFGFGFGLGSAPRARRPAALDWCSGGRPRRQRRPASVIGSRVPNPSPNPKPNPNSNPNPNPSPNPNPNQACERDWK